MNMGWGEVRVGKGVGVRCEGAEVKVIESTKKNIFCELKSTSTTNIHTYTSKCVIDGFSVTNNPKMTPRY